LDKARKKHKLYEICLMRVLCALGIIVYHFNGRSACNIKIFDRIANGFWGPILVTIFFSISGAVLYYNYNGSFNIVRFYYKRWKSIYPAFYLCFIYLYLQNVFKYGKIFYNDKPASLILSFLGLDGYFYYKSPNYYLIGEWFIGAIIMLYIIYPLLVKVYNKQPLVTIAIVLAGYAFILNTNFFTISVSRNLISCLISFLFGIVAIQNKSIIENKLTIIISTFITVIVLFVSIPIPNDISQHIAGFALFIVLWNLGKIVMKRNVINIIITELDKITFHIFLYQNIAIGKFIGLKNPTSLGKKIIWCLIVIIYTIICAKIISVVVASIINSKPMKKIDSYFLEPKKQTK